MTSGISNYWQLFYEEVLMPEMKRAALVAVLAFDGQIFLATELADAIGNLQDRDYRVEDLNATDILPTLEKFGVIVGVPKIHRDEERSWLIVTSVRTWLQDHEIGLDDYPICCKDPEDHETAAIVNFIGENIDSAPGEEGKDDEWTSLAMRALIYATITQYADVDGVNITGPGGERDDIIIGPYTREGPDPEKYYDYAIDGEFTADQFQFREDLSEPKKQLKQSLETRLALFQTAAAYARSQEVEMSTIKEEMDPNVDILCEDPDPYVLFSSQYNKKKTWL